jgi:hypothetical protein
MPNETPTTPEPVLAKTLIPQDLHDRGYIKPWLDKPWTPELATEVFKKLDGAETLIGKKTLIPDDKSDPKDVEAFYSKMRPEKAEDYEFQLGEKADPEFDKVLRGAAHKAGVDKRQMSAFVKELAPHFQAAAKAQADAESAKEAEYTKLVQESVGAEYEKKQAQVAAAVKEFAPENAKALMDKLDNKALALVVALTHGILAKYASADDLSNLGSKSVGTGTDKASLLEEAKKIYASVAWKDFQNPGHEAAKKRVDEIFADPAFK